MALLKEIWFLVRQTFSKSSKDRVSRLASSLAFYAVFCIAPLLLIAVRVAALFFGKGTARDQLAAQLNGLLGKEAAGAVFSLVIKASAPGAGGVIATISSFVLLGYATIILFDELQDSMNTIWAVESKPTSSWWRTLRNQFVSSAIVLGIILLFLISVIISTAMPAVTHYVSGSVSVLGAPIEFFTTFAIFSVVFGIGYKFLPDAKVSWGDVWIASLLAGALFSLGKQVLSKYLVRTGNTSIYGATGSVAVILIWVYYSARVFFFGAEFTKVFSDRTRPGHKPRCSSQ